MPVGSNWLGDDHRPRVRRLFEGTGVHRPATAEEAATQGWYWRPQPGAALIPDTRKCAECGAIMFAPAVLTVDEANLRHGLSTNVLLGEPTQP